MEKKKIILLLYITFSSCLFSIDKSVYWGKWESNFKNYSISLEIKEKNRIKLLINNKEINGLYFEYIYPKGGWLPYLYLKWEGKNYSEYCLNLVPANIDTSINFDILVGVFTKSYLVDEKREIEEIEYIPVKFKYKKNKE